MAMSIKFPTTSIGAALALCTCLAHPSFGDTTPLSSVVVAADSAFVSGQIAKDLSGAACRPAQLSGMFTCAFVDDESALLQFAAFDRGRLRLVSPTPIVGRSKPTGILGTQPLSGDCDADEFGELDAEAVTFSTTHLYVVGSHGCSRKKSKFRESSFLLSRAPLIGDFAVGAFEYSYRLSDVLAAAEHVGNYFTEKLKIENNVNPNGLNIEGAVIQGDQLLVGLRAPSISGNAYIVSTPLAPLFAPASETVNSTSTTLTIALGANRGIRGLEALSDGRLLILTGPSQEPDRGQEHQYSIVVRATDGALSAPTLLAGVLVEPGKYAKAEGLAIVGGTGNIRNLLITYDGLETDAVRRVEFTLP